MAILPEVCEEDDIPPSSSGFRRPNFELHRKRGIRIYTIMFVIQLFVGVGCVACSISAIKLGASETGVPYYTGSLLIAVLMLFSSLLAFRIYNKGPAFSVDDAAKKDVTCALNCHHTCSFLLFFGTVVGLALLWMYGLCFGDDRVTCSYGDSHVTENRIVAGINFVLGTCALASSGVGVCLIRKYGRAFGLEGRPRRGESSAHNRNGLRRTISMQDVFSLSSPSRFDYGLQHSDGVTNIAFEYPCSLPPYSTTVHSQNIPREPPPPYTEVSHTDVTLEGNTHL